MAMSLWPRFLAHPVFLTKMHCKVNGKSKLYTGRMLHYYSCLKICKPQQMSHSKIKEKQHKITCVRLLR